MKTTTTNEIMVILKHHKDVNYGTDRNNLRFVEAHKFATEEEAREFIEYRAAELQAEELNKLEFETEELKEEVIGYNFETQTYGNKTFAPYFDSVSRKGYYEFTIIK